MRMRPPNGSHAAMPVSSKRTMRTLGEPSGARGGMYGSQSGTESRTSTLIFPLNGSGIVSPRMARGDAARGDAMNATGERSSPVSGDAGSPARPRGSRRGGHDQGPREGHDLGAGRGLRDGLGRLLSRGAARAPGRGRGLLDRPPPGDRGAVRALR